MNQDLNYHGRTIRTWIQRFDTGNLRLPKFQRSYVWKAPKVGEFLESVLKDRPLGTLLLISDDLDKFPSRLFKGVPDVTNAQDNALVLDGQQRLTSLWMALRGDYKFYVKVKDGTRTHLRLMKFRNLMTLPVARVLPNCMKNYVFHSNFLVVPAQAAPTTVSVGVKKL